MFPTDLAALSKETLAHIHLSFPPSSSTHRDEGSIQIDALPYPLFPLHSTYQYLPVPVFLPTFGKKNSHKEWDDFTYPFPNILYKTTSPLYLFTIGRGGSCANVHTGF